MTAMSKDVTLRILVVLLMALNEIKLTSSHPLVEDVDQYLMDGYIADGCPFENYRGITVSSVDTTYLLNGFVNPGVKLHSRCQYGQIYPQTSRECLPSGKYREVKPTCTPTAEEITSNERYITPVPFKAEDCSESADCQEALKLWVRIGQLARDHDGCQPTIGYGSSQGSNLKLILLEFYQHIYTSFITFNAYDPSGQRIIESVDVLVSVGHDITELSEDAKALHSRLYDVVLSRKRKPHQWCTVRDITAHAKQLLIVAKAAEGYDLGSWEPNFKFYSVPQWNTTNHLKTDSEVPQCLEKPPLIPHASVIYTSSNRSMTIKCDDGYILIDPVTSKQSLGIVECAKGLEHSPYHLPACIKATETHQTKHSSRETDASRGFGETLSIAKADPGRRITSTSTVQPKKVDEELISYDPLFLVIGLLGITGVLSLLFVCCCCYCGQNSRFSKAKLKLAELKRVAFRRNEEKKDKLKSSQRLMPTAQVHFENIHGTGEPRERS